MTRKFNLLFSFIPSSFVDQFVDIVNIAIKGVTSHYLQYMDPALLAHYTTAAANANSLLFYPSPHPFSLSAFLVAERFTNKNSGIAELRMKAQKHAAALGL